MTPNRLIEFSRSDKLKQIFKLTVAMILTACRVLVGFTRCRSFSIEKVSEDIHLKTLLVVALWGKERKQKKRKMLDWLEDLNNQATYCMHDTRGRIVRRFQSCALVNKIGGHAERVPPTASNRLCFLLSSCQVRKKEKVTTYYSSSLQQIRW